MLTVTQPLELGDSEGHPFHGNQYTDAPGGLKDENPIKPGVQVTALHTTSREAANLIKEHGFDPLANGAGSAFGKGIYVSPETESGRYGQDQMREMKGYGEEQLEVEVTYTNPVVITADDIDPFPESTPFGNEPIFNVILERAGVDPSEPGRGVDAEVLRNDLLDAGVDAIIYRDPKLTEPDWWGDQIVVLNGDQVVVKGERPITAAASRNMQLRTLPELIEHLHRRATTASVELGEGAGHAFRGNQWTSGIDSPEHDIQPEERVRFVQPGEPVNPKGSDPVGTMITSVPSPFGKGDLTMVGPGAKEYGDIFNDMFRDYVITMGKDAPQLALDPKGPAEAERIRADWAKQIAPSLGCERFEYLPHSEKLANGAIAYASAERNGEAGLVAEKYSNHVFYTDDEVAALVKPEESMFSAVQRLEFGALEFYSEDEPRDETGKWTDGGGGSGESHVVTSAQEALERLSRGERVTLPADQVSTLLDKMSAAVKDAQEKGKDAPNVDLCNLTVPDTNLFCAESKGIPRIEMPQLKGIPEEGSKAYEKFGPDEVDLGQRFRDSLEKDGVDTKRDEVDASHLKATQNELNGAKVARFLDSFDSGKHDPADSKIYVSKDNYVLDGHHHWAAAVAYDYNDDKPGDVKVGVIKIDLPIVDLVKRANDFTEKWGIPHAAATVASVIGLELGDSEGHPFRGNQYTDSNTTEFNRLADTVNHDLPDVGTDAAYYVAARTWSNSFEATDRMQNAADFALNVDGAKAPRGEDAWGARELLTSIRDSDAPNHVETDEQQYRGMVDHDGTIMQTFKEGSDVAFALASFSPNEDTPNMFIDFHLSGSWGGVGKDGTPIVLQTAGTLVGTDISAGLDHGSSFHEIVTGGTFRVEAVQPQAPVDDDSPGAVIITIRQVALP